MKHFATISPARAAAFATICVAALTSQVASAERVTAQFKAPGAAAAVAAVGVKAPAAPVVRATAAPVVKAVAAPAAKSPGVNAVATTAAKPAVVKAVATPAAQSTIKFSSPERVRSAIKFQTVKWAGKPVQTLDEPSRILLAKAAAEKAGLHEVGLSYRDVYGVIEAETSWIPRTGSSKNGTPNLGLAQFEPRTAQGMGLKDPNDPVQAVFAAAQYMKMGAEWASGRIGHLKSDPDLYAAKLREGVSVHYNLSVKGRNKWNGLNTAQLPVETQRHIRNAALGAKEAAELSRRISA